MLSDAEKERIRCEEIYRCEFVKSVEAKTSNWRAKSAKFFNTALGLWVLSSLVLGGASFILGMVLNFQAKNHAKKQRIGMIYIELAHRFSDAQSEASRITDNSQVDTNSWIEEGAELFVPLRVTSIDPTVDYSSAFAEFKGRTLRALFVELTILGNSSDKTNALELRNIVEELQKTIEKHDANPQEVIDGLLKRAKTFLEKEFLTVF